MTWQYPYFKLNLLRDQNFDLSRTIYLTLSQIFVLDVVIYMLTAIMFSFMFEHLFHVSKCDYTL